jgi:fructose-1,6-bisphosphatase/sedoheptulose 1,7-bisphosphatase-like protein
MDRMFPAHILAVANKRAETVTDAEVALCVAALLADPRVASARTAGRDVSGRALVEVAAIDAIGGDLSGTVTVGRAVNALSETQSGHAQRRERQREEEARWKEEARRMAEEREAERKENTRLLYALGVTHSDLMSIGNRLIRGTYINADDLAKWRLYLDLVVKGRPRELDLGLYVHGIQPL